MKAQSLHSWSVSPGEAIRIQQDLSRKISCSNEVNDARCIAGVDISGPDREGVARSAVVVLSYPDLMLTEVKSVEQKVTFPYVPGLLSFRESPLIIAACERLESEPDLVFVDGQGLAHPRRLGLASHLGILWDKPTIGCAKSRLCGVHDEVPFERGLFANLVHNSEVIGAALRTKQGVSPMYISIGHRIDLRSAIDWVLKCCRGYRVPEPTRLAHQAAGGKLQGKAVTSQKKHTQISLF